MKFISITATEFLLARHVDAFSTTMARPAMRRSSNNIAGPLNVGAVMDWDGRDLDESFLMKRAESYANSAQASLAELRTALEDVIRVQSGCVSGTVLGDVCDNVGAAAELVANLRQKIKRKEVEEAITKTTSCVATVSVAMVAMSVLASGLGALHLDASPFTPEEVWWSIRDGYFPDLVSHYFRHGGLATLEYESGTTPFVLQEWWWAFKGGYFGNMVEHYFRNGGLATAEGFSLEATPFTPNEWLSAAKGGFVDQVMSQNFKYGGLATAESLDAEAMAISPREILWAARDGYIGDLASHFIRNGGV